jgi:tetratricopeptide (TPR) repeat protein
MNRDHVLYVTIGLLAGFIAGYVMRDVMAGRQPAFQGGGAPSAGPAPAMSAPEAPAAGPSGPGAAQGGPQMAEIQRLRDLVEKNPNDADAVLSLANLNFDIKNWARARELYERRLTLKPGDPDVMTDMGVCYRELGDFQQALGLFNQAQALAPDHWQSRYNKVVVLAFDLKDYDGAQKVLDELQRLQPGNPSIAELAAEVARRRSAA